MLRAVVVFKSIAPHRWTRRTSIRDSSAGVTLVDCAYQNPPSKKELEDTLSGFSGIRAETIFPLALQMVFRLDPTSSIFTMRNVPHTETGAQHSLRLLDWLSPELLSLGAPREMRDGDDEEAVARIRDTRQGIIPSEEGSKKPEVATSLDAAGIGAVGIGFQVADTQQEEGHV